MHSRALVQIPSGARLAFIRVSAPACFERPSTHRATVLPRVHTLPWLTMAAVRTTIAYLLVVLTAVHADEVSALVIDIGTSSLRAGYAGDDTPKAIVPTSYGYIEQESLAGEDVTMEDAGEEEKKPSKKAKLFIGQNGPSMWREGMRISNPVHGGMSRCIHTSYSRP